MKAFYSDHFVLPLPEGHRFPMSKYARLRARVIAEGVVAAERPRRGAGGFMGRTAAGARRRLRAGRRRRHAAAGDAAPHRISLVAGDGRAVPAFDRRHDRRRPGRSGRWRRRRTWPAARTTPSPTAARGSVSSTTWRSPPACLQRERLMQTCGRHRLDVHQGNGTAAIFRDDPTVFTFSMHGARNFPFRKEAATSTSSSPMARATTSTWHCWRATCPPCSTPPAGHGLLPGGRRPVRGRSPRPSGAVDRWPAGPR